MFIKTLLALAALALACLVPAQHPVKIKQDVGTFHLLLTGPMTHIGPNNPVNFDLFVTDRQSSKPVRGLKITAKLEMPSMPGMGLSQPEVKELEQPGHYMMGKVGFTMSGEYALKLSINPGQSLAAYPTFTLHPQFASEMPMQHEQDMHDMPGMEGMHEMKGSLGDWPMNREGSGTTWQPDSTPMFMKMLPKAGRYDLDLMGELQTGYVDAGGKRGDSQLYANSMAMWMARRETGGGILGLHIMMSLDPITKGKKGVPNLFQTGETYNGQPLVDRQHPHDFLSEVAASFSKKVGRDSQAFLYLAPIGEPALGNVMFMHRASGMEVPEAPISHHWFDSTHISFGVATLGLTLQDKWKIEASAFNGHEPDENRFGIDPIQLNSASGRLSFNPDANWSFSTSYGYLNSPEALEPGVDQHRVTASATYSRPLAGGDNWSTTLLFGRNVRRSAPDSDAVLLESTLYRGSNSFFGRFERVDKDELVGVPEGSYSVNKLVFGMTHDVVSRDAFDFGVGGYLGVYDFPSSLDAYYGSHPTTWGVFIRVRPSRM